MTHNCPAKLKQKINYEKKLCLNFYLSRLLHSEIGNVGRAKSNGSEASKAGSHGYGKRSYTRAVGTA